MVNQVVVDGRIVTDIPLRHSKSGVPVTDFRIRHKTRKMPHPLYIDVEVWGAEAERLAEYASRDDRVVIANGELRCDVWEKEGQKRSKIKITAGRVILIQDIPFKDRNGNDEESSF